MVYDFDELGNEDIKNEIYIFRLKIHNYLFNQMSSLTILKKKKKLLLYLIYYIWILVYNYRFMRFVLMLVWGLGFGWSFELIFLLCLNLLGILKLGGHEYPFYRRQFRLFWDWWWIGYCTFVYQSNIVKDYQTCNWRRSQSSNQPIRTIFHW